MSYDVNKDWSFILNKKYGYLKVISVFGKCGRSNRAKVECICGKVFTVYCKTLEERIKSCGCKRIEPIGNPNQTHGLSAWSLYAVWHSMIKRCSDVNDKYFKDYGGRGISVCEEWLEIANFYNWCKVSGYEKGLLIERVNNDGNYEPSNCTWATNKEQSRNRRNNIYLEYKGERKILTDWAKVKGISVTALWLRIKKGWGIEKALTTPLMNNQYTFKS